MDDTSAHVDITTANNVTWIDAFQFGEDGDTSWSFTGQKFRCDIKGNEEQASPLLSLLSDDGEIVVDDAVNRILHTNVPESAIQAALVPGEYVYDFIMYNTAVPAVRIMLMHGKLTVVEGITGG